MNEKLQSTVNIKDNVKIYIRHCDERTVPVLKWFFRGFNLGLINGENRKFPDVLEELFINIKEQVQSFALVLDGDLVPLISTDEMIKLFIKPLTTTKKIITINGDRIDKFVTMDRALIGGIKSYRKSRVDLYLKNLDKKQIRPESFLYNKVGHFHHLRTKVPQVGHEYGQFLWHLYEKAFQRGAKATKEVMMRQGHDLDFEVYEQAYNAGKKSQKNFVTNLYKKENLPAMFSDHEKQAISPYNAEMEYLKLKEEINKDIKNDINDKYINTPFKTDVKDEKWSMKKMIKRRLL